MIGKKPALHFLLFYHSIWTKKAHQQLFITTFQEEILLDCFSVPDPTLAIFWIWILYRNGEIFELFVKLSYKHEEIHSDSTFCNYLHPNGRYAGFIIPNYRVLDSFGSRYKWKNWNFNNPGKLIFQLTPAIPAGHSLGEQLKRKRYVQYKGKNFIPYRIEVGPSLG